MNFIDIEKVYVTGYVRKDGRQVKGYWRRKAVVQRIFSQTERAAAVPPDLFILI